MNEINKWQCKTQRTNKDRRTFNVIKKFYQNKKSYHKMSKREEKNLYQVTINYKTEIQQILLQNLQ